MRRILTVNIMILLIFASVSYWMEEGEKLKDTMASAETVQAEVSEPEEKKKYIKWVDFQVSCLALSESYEYDRDTYGTDHHISWIDLLAWTAAHTGGSFSDDRKVCSLLTKLEDRYHITIELFEMEQCLSVGTLIDMIDIKWKEKPV